MHTYSQHLNHLNEGFLTLRVSIKDSHLLSKQMSCEYFIVKKCIHTYAQVYTDVHDVDTNTYTLHQCKCMHTHTLSHIYLYFAQLRSYQGTPVKNLSFE